MSGSVSGGSFVALSAVTCSSVCCTISFVRDYIKFYGSAAGLVPAAAYQLLLFSLFVSSSPC